MVLNEDILFFSNLKKLIIVGYLKRFSKKIKKAKEQVESVKLFRNNSLRSSIIVLATEE